MAGRLILFGLLWLMAISIITGAAFLYFNDSQHLTFKKQMYRLKNDDKE